MNRGNLVRPAGAPRPPRNPSPVGHLHLRKSLWHHVHVATIDPDDSDPLLAPVMAAVAAVADAEKALDARRGELSKVVADAIRKGVKPAVLVRKTKKSAETIRTMARENGVEPLRDPRGATKAASPADRIASELRTQIQAGEMLDGQQLPTVADLMRRFNAAQATVQRAIVLLVSEGLAEVRRGEGAFACVPRREVQSAPPTVG
jgi:regulatory GntR family protein